MTSQRMIETFNTHRMTDEVVRAVATGRDDELAQIMPAIRRAAADPSTTPPALIVYGERGSGKSFLMRLVQLESADIEDIVCVLLPEEQYNIRSPQQILQVVTAHIRGQDWSTMGWQIDGRTDEDAWRQELESFYKALDARFGEGKGVAVVLLENFDNLVNKLFGVKATPKGSASGPAVARRQAEERLRKLLGARGSRFMLIASATGTVDMDYERPLFHAFTPVDLRGWSADTAIDYYNKRRELDGQPPLTGVEQARARAITEFIGGNARLAQLLGTVLSSPSARTISNTLDELVDHLADYYRQRLDALPLASASVLDAMIRGGEPVTQTGLAARVQGGQQHIADAFSFLTRGRLVQATREIGGAGQLYRVRDRLFVHFYRRRYGNAAGLAAIAELLESFFTPDERELMIREHLERGELDDARAYGRLSLGGKRCEPGSCNFQDAGITDGPPRPWFAQAGVAEADIATRRQELRDDPGGASKYWLERAENATGLLEGTAATVLAAVAECHNGNDVIAQHLLDKAVESARTADDADALIVASDAAALFYGQRVRDGRAKSLELLEDMAGLSNRTTRVDIKTTALTCAAFYAHSNKQYSEAEKLLSDLLGEALPSRKRIAALTGLAHVLMDIDRLEEALRAVDELLKLVRKHATQIGQYNALGFRSELLMKMKRYEEGLESARERVAAALELGMITGRAMALLNLGVYQMLLNQFDDALVSAREGLRLALKAENPEGQVVARLELLEAKVILAKGDYSAHELLSQKAGQALDYANKAGDKELIHVALNTLIYAACFTPIPYALEALAHTLDHDADMSILDDPWTVRNNWPWATAHAQSWEASLALAQRHPTLMQGANSPWPVLDIVGKIWSENAVRDGRAVAYAQASKDIQAIKALFDLEDALKVPVPYKRTSSALRGLSDSLSQHCDDPGFLRDLAGLLETHFTEVAGEPATLLRQFADFHAAPDKEAYLQYIDPDLSTAIRRIWNLPEPKDTLAKRGRRRAR